MYQDMIFCKYNHIFKWLLMIFAICFWEENMIILLSYELFWTN